ncbi:hypothetical protein ANTRET_LOCUS4423 [Anthophora retusa]
MQYRDTGIPNTGILSHFYNFAIPVFTSLNTVFSVFTRNFLNCLQYMFRNRQHSKIIFNKLLLTLRALWPHICVFSKSSAWTKGAYMRLSIFSINIQSFSCKINTGALVKFFTHN